MITMGCCFFEGDLIHVFMINKISLPLRFPPFFSFLPPAVPSCLQTQNEPFDLRRKKGQSPEKDCAPHNVFTTTQGFTLLPTPFRTCYLFSVLWSFWVWCWWWRWCCCHCCCHDHYHVYYYYTIIMFTIFFFLVFFFMFAFDLCVCPLSTVWWFSLHFISFSFTCSK